MVQNSKSNRSPIAITNRCMARFLETLPPEKKPVVSKNPKRRVWGLALRLPLLICVALTAGGILNVGILSGAFNREHAKELNAPQAGLFIGCTACGAYQFNARNIHEALKVRASAYSYYRACHSTAPLQIQVCCPQCGHCYVPSVQLTPLGELSEKRYSCSISAVCPRCRNSYLVRNNILISDDE